MIDRETYKSAKVIYVEPNWVGGGAYSDTSNSPLSMQKQPLEDYCLYVNLEVEKKGRTVTVAGGGENTTYVLQWTNTGESAGKVNFLQGRKIKLANGRETFSLTDNYTTYLGDIKDGSDTNEMFGISSIDIKYNEYMVPIISIKFVDVRGAALFSLEERSHQEAHNNITGFRNDDIVSSFFSSFFTFPYPKFYLTVKGFYGQPVGYELTCTDFNARFDSSTGNYNVDVTLAGYQFSFLNDVSFNLMVAAPYSDAGGKEYWESRVENVDSDFYLVGVNGEKRNMVTLGSLLISLANIQEKVKALTETDEAHTRQSELEDKATMISQIWSARSEYISTMQAELKEKYEKETFQVIDGGRFVAFVSNIPRHTEEEPVYELDKFDVSIDKFNIFKGMVEQAQLSTTIPEYEKSITKSVMYRYASNTKVFIPTAGIHELPDNQALYSHMDAFAKEDVGKQPDDRFFNYEVKDKDGNHYHYRGFFQDLGGGLQESLEESANKVETELGQNQAEVEKSESDAVATILGFQPTVYNFTKIIMAHLECLMKMFYDLSIKIYADKDGRTPSALGIGEAKTDSEDKLFVPPFPKLTTVKPLRTAVTSDSNMNGSEGQQTTMRVSNGQTVVEEDEWVGEMSGHFLEEDFIDGILNGAFEVGQLIRRNMLEEGKEGSVGESGESERICAVEIPVCPMDMILADNPWGSISEGSGKGISDAAFVGKCYYRMIQVLTYSSSLDYDLASTIGTLDAINFSKLFKGPSKEFVNKLSTMSFEDYYLPIVTGADKKYMVDGVWPWTPQNGENTGLVPSTGVRHPLIGKLTAGYVLPVCGVSFKGFKSDVNMASDGTCSVPSDLTNYIVTDNTKEPKENRNDFIVDKAYGDYGNFYDKIILSSDDNSSDIEKLKEKRFSGCKFNQDEYKIKIADINKLFDGDGFTDVAGINAMKLKNLPAVYQGDGGVLIDEGGSLFGSRLFYSAVDKFEQGYLFLRSVSDYLHWSEPNLFASKTLEHFRILPYSVGLIVGSKLWLNEQNGHRFGSIDKIAFSSLTNVMKATYINMFKNWCVGDLQKIIDTFSPGFNAAAFTRSKDIKDSEIQIMTDLEQYQKIYKLEKISFKGKSQSFELKFRDDIDTGMINSALLTPAMYGKLTTRINGIIPAVVNDGVAKTYWDAFIAQLKVQYEGILNDDGTREREKTKKSDTPIDIKISLYRHCKTLYDKWIAGTSLKDDFEDRWCLWNFFAPNDNKSGRFHFIDSFYNDMSDIVLVNPQIIVEDIKTSASLDSLNLLSVLGDLFSKNRFNFMCIQNFVSLETAGKMMDMFVPIPYQEMDRPKMYPDFVAVYLYEPSKHLDIEGSEYPDDGFMINGDSSMWPTAIATKSILRDYQIPAFGVAYGMQYQSYFTDISLGMEKAQNTEQSLKVQYLLAGMNTEGMKSRQFVTWGQDLFTNYANMSYEANVTMLGCSWIQPLMYFCLTNVPLFKGTYMVQHVTHSITPGNMTTKFSGPRIANVASRIAKDWLAKGYGSYAREGIYGSGAAQEQGTKASIDNDCEYKLYPLYGGGTGDYAVPMNASQEEYARKGLAFFMKELACDDIHAAAIGGNICAESSWNPNIKEGGGSGEGLIQWTDPARRLDNWATFYKQRHPGKPVPRIKDSTFEDQLWYMVYERNHGEKGSYNQFFRTSTLENATTTYCCRVERPRAHVHEKRISFAKKMLELIRNGSVQTSTQTSNTGTSGKKKPDDIESNELKVRDNALIECIRKTVETSNQLVGPVTASKVERGGISFVEITGGDTRTTMSIFDMCLNGYHPYVDRLVYMSSSIDGDIIKVRLTTKDSASSTYVQYGAAGTAVTQYSGLNQNFYKSLYKKFGDVGTDKTAFGRLQKTIEPFKSCTNQQEAGNLLSGSGVQPCNPQGSGGYDTPSNYTPSSGYYSTLGDSIDERQKKLFGRKLTRTRSGDPESWCKSFQTNVTVRARRSAGGSPENVTITIHKGIAENLKAVFEDLLNVSGFYLTCNCHAYCYRGVKTPDGRELDKRSNHSYGTAIDVNPNKNPYFGGKKRMPQTGDTSNPLVWRSYDHPVVKIFAKHGFGWGGAYGDTMHFSFFDGT